MFLRAFRARNHVGRVCSPTTTLCTTWNRIKPRGLRWYTEKALESRYPTSVSPIEKIILDGIKARTLQFCRVVKAYAVNRQLVLYHLRRTCKLVLLSLTLGTTQIPKTQSLVHVVTSSRVLRLARFLERWGFLKQTYFECRSDEQTILRLVGRYMVHATVD